MRTTPRILRYSRAKAFPKIALQRIARELRKVGNVRVRDWSPGPQAAAGDWILPALVFMYVARPLFEGFLQELGATGARALRTKLGKFIQRLKKRKNRWITKSGTERLGLESPVLRLSVISVAAYVRSRVQAECSRSGSSRRAFSRRSINRILSSSLRTMPNEAQAVALTSILVALPRYSAGNASLSHSA